MRSKRRVALVGMAAVGFVLVLLVLEVAGLPQLTRIAMGAGIIAAAGAAILAALASRRADARIQETMSTLSKMQASVDGLGKTFKHQRRGLEQVRTELAAIEDRDRGIVAFIASIDERLAAIEHIDAVATRLEGGPGVEPSPLFRQTEALVALYHTLNPVAPLPPTGGWAASADVLVLLHQLVRDERPRQVLECGSGVSTLVLAYALRDIDGASLVTLEHDSQHLANTRDWLRRHGLSDLVELRLAPLVPVETSTPGECWYDPQRLPSGPIDLMFVDGPPSNRGTADRAPALQLVADRLAPDATIVIDDYLRPGDRDTVTAWMEWEPRFALETYPLEKGAAILRLGT
jgi:predicted O-methyltransferase YrrM